MKLKKQTSSEWLGNGMGNTTADWVVVGAEHIAIRKLGTRWSAIDTRAPMGCGRIASADTKNDLISKLKEL